MLRLRADRRRGFAVAGVGGGEHLGDDLFQRAVVNADVFDVVARKQGGEHLRDPPAGDFNFHPRRPRLEVISPFVEEGEETGPLLDLIEALHPEEVRILLPRDAEGAPRVSRATYDRIRALPGVSWAALPPDLIRSGSSEQAAPASSSEQAAPASSSEAVAPASSEQAAPSSVECPEGFEIVDGKCVPIKASGDATQTNGDQSSAAQ